MFKSKSKKREPVVVSGLDKTDRQGEHHELLVRSGRDPKSCVICVGAKGSGKSATISRFNLSQVDSTNNCALYRPSASSGSDGADSLGISWLEVGDWDLSIDETEDCFHDTLQLLLTNGITKIQAVLWHIIPGTVLNNITLYEQARFINMFKSRQIWSNVVVVAKCSSNPERDGKEAARTASEFSRDQDVPIVGYRFHEDPTLSAADRTKFQDPDKRSEYNVKTRDEVREILESKILGSGPPCNLDDDENDHTIPLHTEIKTVFGLPPIVFPKPF